MAAGMDAAMLLALGLGTLPAHPSPVTACILS
jgi:hypothetical protein